MLLRSVALPLIVCSSFVYAQGNSDWDEPFPPYKIIGNVYYVGTKGLANFLITTSDGNILINSDFERNVPTIRSSVKRELPHLRALTEERAFLSGEIAIAARHFARNGNLILFSR